MLAAHDDLLQARSRLLLFATQHALRLGASESQLNIERVVVSCVHLTAGARLVRRRLQAHFGIVRPFQPESLFGSKTP